MEIFFVFLIFYLKLAVVDLILRKYFWQQNEMQYYISHVLNRQDNGNYSGMKSWTSLSYLEIWSAYLCCASLPFSSQLPSKSECPYLEMEGIQDSQYCSPHPSLLACFLWIIHSTISWDQPLKTEMKEWKFRLWLFPTMVSPVSNAVREQSRTQILTTRKPQGSMCTCSAELAVLVVPELRQKHEREFTETNEILQSNNQTA